MLRAFVASMLISAMAAVPAYAQAPAPPPQRPPATVMEPNFPAPLRPGDAFGEPVELPDRTIIYFSGHGTWDKAFETLIDAFRSLNQYLDKHGIKPNGAAMTIFNRTDDLGFDFQAALPLAEAPENPPKGDIAVGKAPSGKALKFVHRGSFDALDTTYEAITNHLDDKRLEARDIFIEEYASEPIKTAEEALVVNIFVPIK